MFKAVEETLIRTSNTAVKAVANPLIVSEHCVGRRIRSSMVWAATGRLLSVLFLFLLHAWLAHRVSAADYGHYILIESVMLVVSLVMMAGLPTVSLRMLRTRSNTANDGGPSQIVKSSLAIVAGTSLLTALVVSIAATAIGNQFLDGIVSKWLLWILMLASCTAMLRIVSELARGFEMLGFSYLIGGQSGGFGVNGVLLLLATLAGVSGGISLWTILTVQVTVQVLCVVLGILVILKATPAPVTTEVSSIQTPKVRQMLQSSLPLLIQQLVTLGLPEADTMMLGSYATAEEIAFYGAARKLVVLAVVPLLLVNHAIQPFIAEFYAKRKQGQLATLVRGAATFAAIPSFLVVMALVIAPELILRTTFGAEYSAAATPLRILCCGTAVFVATGSCGLVLTMTGHERAVMWAALIAGILYLIAAPFLIAEYGITGAAVSAVILQFGANVSAMLLAYFHERIWTGITCSRKSLIECLRLIFPGKFIEASENH